MATKQNEIVLYTNHTCTWAHRAHVALQELQLPFKEVNINVDGPRPDWFLEINPRALVPVLFFNGKKIIESAIVCQFLADVFPSALSPPLTTVEGATRRADMSFFIDAYWNKFHVSLFKLFEAPTKDEEEKVVEEAVTSLVAEVEPLLADANPFWGGSEKLTLAEVMMGPFLLRATTLSKHGVYPQSLNNLIEEKAPNFRRWAVAVCKHPSVTSVFQEDVIVARSKAKRSRLRQAAGLAE